MPAQFRQLRHVRIAEQAGANEEPRVVVQLAVAGVAEHADQFHRLVGGDPQAGEGLGCSVPRHVVGVLREVVLVGEVEREVHPEVVLGLPLAVQRRAGATDGGGDVGELHPCRQVRQFPASALLAGGEGHSGSEVAGAGGKRKVTRHGARCSHLRY